MQIVLTKDSTIDPDSVAMAHLIPWNGEPYAQFLMKREGLLPLSLVGDEAIEVWAKWQAYVAGPKKSAVVVKNENEESDSSPGAANGGTEHSLHQAEAQQGEK